MTFTLRPYQTEARYQLNTLINAHRHPVFVSPTGTGKTKTAVQVIADRVSLGNRVYVIVPQDEIFRPWVRDLSDAGLNPGQIAGGKIQGASRMVYVCMAMTLVNLLQMIPEAIHPDEIWTDECHHSAASTWEAVYDFFPDAVRVGLTATPRRTDGKPLDHLYTDIVETITMQEAITATPRPYLAAPLPIVPGLYLDEVPINNGEFDCQIQAQKLGKTTIVGDVIENYSLTFAGLPVLVACSTFEHAEMMTEMFNQAGWNFGHIHSGLHFRERRKLLRQIESGRLNGLCTVGIGIEGMDIPGLYGLIWLRRTMSLTIYLQFIGRVLRPLPGKKYGIILDPVGNLFIHGRPELHRNWTLEGFGGDGAEIDPEEIQPDRMRICPFCGVMNNIDNTVCHFCGRDMDSPEAAELKRRKLPAMVDGVLVAVESDGQAEEIRQRAERIKEEQQEAAKERERARQTAEEAGGGCALSDGEKMEILRGGMGMFTEKRKIFREAVKNYL